MARGSETGKIGDRYRSDFLNMGYEPQTELSKEINTLSLCASLADENIPSIGLFCQLFLG